MPVFRINTYGIFVVSVSLITFFLYWLSGQRSISISKSPVISVRRLLSSCIYLARRGGEAIVEVHDRSAVKTFTKMSLGKEEILTEADLLSHRRIHLGLLKSLPGINMISEEKLIDYDDWLGTTLPTEEDPDVAKRIENRDLYLPLDELTVWIDPLDATQEFSENLLDYVTVMLCVAFKDHPIIGVIYQPFTKKIYWSWENFGVSSDLEELYSVRKNDSLSLDVTMSRSHLKKDMEKVFNETFAQENLKIIRSAGSGYKILQLIKNEANLYLHPETIKKWDICAPNALLNAVSGGLYTIDPFHEPIDYSFKSSQHINRKTGIFGVANEKVATKYSEKIKKFLRQYHNH